jgi:response regulator RpfG family c-di-GMP phosphodiesterase
MESTKRTILCVDDESDIVSSLYDTFMDKYVVKTATSGAAALAIFQQEDIALIISDQRMPLMTGTELLAQINELKPKCKKILLTGYADMQAAIDAINKGAVDKYISKPWDDDDLEKTVADLIRRYENELSFAKLLEDTRSLKEAVKKTRGSLDMFEKFITSYQCGICILSEEGQIDFINKTGLDIMRYADLTQIKGRSAEEIFLSTYPNRSFFMEKFMERQQVFDTLEVKTGDGALTDMQVSLAFEMINGEVRVSGIVFFK